MTVLGDMSANIDIFYQMNLVNRIAVRLGRSDMPFNKPTKYESEEKLLEDFKLLPLYGNFQRWNDLESEMEFESFKLKDAPNALDLYFVRAMQNFSETSAIVFPSEDRPEEDQKLARILRYLAYYCGYYWPYNESHARQTLLHVLGDLNLISDTAAHGGAMTEEETNFVEANRKDFVLLQNLLESMVQLGHIIQGLYFKVGSTKSLFQLQEESGLTLCETLYAWKIGNLLRVSTKFCRQMIGGNDKLKKADFIADTNPESKPASEQAPVDISLEENLVPLCHRLKPDYVRVDEDGLLYFTGGASLYAYMCSRITAKCNLKTIPWRTFKSFLSISSDSSYLKQAAHKLKKKDNLPRGYAVIDDAINEIFK